MTRVRYGTSLPGEKIMLKTKLPLPYLLRVENAAESALLVELIKRAATSAEKAHTLATLYAKVIQCERHFAPAAVPDSPKNGT
jgi:hypothetical protein